MTDLQTELSNTAELLAASTEARRMMADTIRDLRTENGALRAALDEAYATIALLRYGTPRKLTDRGDRYDLSHMQDCPERPLNGAVSDFTREGGE